MTNPFTEDGHVDFIQLWAWGTAITARDKRDALTVVLIHNEKPVRARWREWGKGSLGGGRKGCSGEISKLCCACRLPHSQSCHGQHAARYLGLGQSAAFSTRWFKLVYVISVRRTARPMVFEDLRRTDENQALLVLYSS